MELNHSQQQYEEVGWCLIPPYIITREDLSPTQKIFYGRIQGLTGKKGYCYASNRWLGAQLGIEPETITSILHKLQSLGLAQVQVIRKDGTKEVLERRIYLTQPSPMAVGDLPYGGRGPSPMAVGDHIKGRDKGREKNLNINTASAVPITLDQQLSHSVEEDLPLPSSHSTVKRIRTIPSIPLPEKDPPIPEEIRPDPVKSAGFRLMRDNGTIGFSSLHNKLFGHPITKHTIYQNVTPLGKLAVEQKTSEELIREVMAWLEHHAFDKYTPTFSNGYEFSKKFGALVSAMKKSKKEKDKPTYGPLSTCLTPEEAKAKYGGFKNGDVKIKDGIGYVYRDGDWRETKNGKEIGK